jgi:hypothetical protein
MNILLPDLPGRRAAMSSSDNLRYPKPPTQIFLRANDTKEQTGKKPGAVATYNKNPPTGKACCMGNTATNNPRQPVAT